jgi:prephenate dehydratase
MIRAAFQGDRGAFSEAAGERLWGDRWERVPRSTFAGVVAAVECGTADRGILPVENTIAGSVTESVAVLRASALVETCGRIEVPIRLNLLGLRGSTIEGLAVVASHPVALAQCRAYLAALRHLSVLEWFDTAGAARHVSETADPSFGAVAGESAADRYNLDVLARDVHDRSDNVTRFVVIRRRP